MSKKLTLEIEKARVDRNWSAVLSLIHSYNPKSSTLVADEFEVYRLLHLGEAQLEETLQTEQNHPTHVVSKDKLQPAFENLYQALRESEGLKDRLQYLHYDSRFLVSKYYFVTGEYRMCVDLMNAFKKVGEEKWSLRTKHLYAEACICQGLSCERLAPNNTLDLIGSFSKASQLALSVLIDEEQSNNKSTFSPVSVKSSPLLQYGIVKAAHFMLVNTEVGRTVDTYRKLIKAIEVKSTYAVRKVLCRRLAEVLQAFVSPCNYTSPVEEANLDGSVSITPTEGRPLQKSNINGAFVPSNQFEESILSLLISDTMHCTNATVFLSDKNNTSKTKTLNETNIIIDLLALSLSKEYQYSFLSQVVEKSMKFSFEEYHLSYQFALSLLASGKYERAFLICERCHQLKPERMEPLTLLVKLCINHLQKYEAGLKYASILEEDEDEHVKSMGLLASGVCHHHIACQASSTTLYREGMNLAIKTLMRASALDPNDTEILFHLSLNQALSKQLAKAIATIKTSLSIDCFDLNALHLFSLLLSAERKYEEASEVLNTAIVEHPNDLNLLLTKMRLAKKLYGDESTLAVCHDMFTTWNELYQRNVEDDEPFTELELPADAPKSPASKTDRSSVVLNKKFNMNEATSLREEDGTSSIATSTQLERTLSEVASGSFASLLRSEATVYMALLCKLWLVTAECFICMGDDTQATNCLREVLSKFAVSADVLYMRGRLSELQVNLGESKACYESALAINPKHSSAAQRLGLLYFEEGKYLLAEKTIRGCILQDTSNHTAWNDLGIVLESSGQHCAAVDCYLTSLQLESTAPIIPYLSLPRLFRS